MAGYMPLLAATWLQGNLNAIAAFMGTGAWSI